MSFEDGEPEWSPDFEDDDEPEDDQLPCPSCGAMVYDDTDRCPHCGDWIMPLASAAGRKSRLWIVAAILVIIAMVIWAVT